MTCLFSAVRFPRILSRETLTAAGGKTSMRIAILIFSLVIAVSTASAQAPTGIIFDTDMGNDVDDALALAMLHAFQSRHEINLLAVTVTKDNKWAAPYVDVVNHFYGCPEIPIGTVRNGKTPESNPMIEIPSARRRPDGSFVYPHRLLDGAQAPEAVPCCGRRWRNKKMAAS